MLKENKMPAILENDIYKIVLQDDLSLELLDKKYSGSWISKEPFNLHYGDSWYFPLRTHADHTVEKTDDTIHIYFRNLTGFARFRENQYRRPQYLPDFVFHFSIQLLNGREDHIQNR